MGRFWLLLLAVTGLFAFAGEASAGRRVALVLGNGNYEAAGALANPVNDAADIAASLRAIGFEVVEGHDLPKRELERRIGEFSDLLPGADVGMLFYAGHGLQVDGRNYILPVDARLDVPAKLRLEAFPIDDVIDIIEGQATISLVFLDACRNNPFGRGLTTSSRAARPLQGLAQFDASRGAFIAFATAPGAVALDGTGRNSPFTGALLRHIAIPGQSINDMMIAVRRDVIAETRDGQRPWEQGSLTERFEFVPVEGAEPAPVATAAQSPGPRVASLERSTGDTAGIEGFIREVYLSPRPGEVEAMVRRAYATPTSVFGVSLDEVALLKAKTDWFAAYAGWTLSLDPGSLAVTPRGPDAASAVFDMAYDYRAKAAPSSPIAGRARVRLDLARVDGAWRVTSESSEPLP